jgi:1,4-alpha-glucan branching enzyme
MLENAQEFLEVNYMAQTVVHFTFHSGVKRPLFRNVRLSGSWDSWSEAPMQATTDETGCAAFVATVAFDSSQTGTAFQWGVVADVNGTPNTWAIVTEVPNANSDQRYRSFVLATETPTQEYWFATGRKLGAQKWLGGVRFSVWAPNAKSVEVVFAPFNLSSGTPSGYIADDGTGIDAASPVIPLLAAADGTWASDGSLAPVDEFMNRLYMYRITNEQGAQTYKVDIFSRNQAGRGDYDPNGKSWGGSYLDLDGTVSCSIVSDPDQVTKDFDDTGVDKTSLISEKDFWASEFTAGRVPPKNLEDLVIYELHVGSLGYPSTEAGTFGDAMNFVAQLSDLGVNAVELMPVLEFDGNKQWGYGTLLFFCLQSSAGGGNQLKHFVRACHQRGIAVIMDVVFNHFSDSGNERAEWGYDSDPNVAPQNNIFYWYEGTPSDYGGQIDGGYLNNDSTGYAPRFSDETVRQMFTSSAAALLDEYHIDGLRVDLTDAIHQNNSLNANGDIVPAANEYGIKFLRELARTVKMVNPLAFLTAEDHTGWSAMTQSLDSGGIGFNATWYVDFYHHLIGDGDYGDNYARLLKHAGYGVPGPLNMDYFADALLATQSNKIVYHESHDEAGNEDNTERTIVTAVNGAALIGATRKYAEGRCRFAFGMAALSAGTPMFLMGEEIGAAKYFRYNDFYNNKEDLIGQRAGDGQFLYAFYKALIRFVTASTAARSLSLDVIYTHNDNRVVAFTRTAPKQELLVIGSLNDSAFDHGYVIGTDAARLPAGTWQEVFNSDAAAYGGDGVNNGSSLLQASNGSVNAILPAHGFIVLERKG